jgi:hypothetical protein
MYEVHCEMTDPEQSKENVSIILNQHIAFLERVILLTGIMQIFGGECAREARLACGVFSK